MNARFLDHAGTAIHWVDPVDESDIRVQSGPSEKRTNAIMLSHLDMVLEFLEGDAKFGVFCEDDILIRKDFRHSIVIALNAYERFNLDVLLVGYLIDHKLHNLRSESYMSEFKIFEEPYSYHSYPDNLWGAQMYVLDRKAARKVIKNFYSPNTVPVFSPDWTITKFGKRALMYPMLALEEGASPQGHPVHAAYHNKCRDVHFDPEIFG